MACVTSDTELKGVVMERRNDELVEIETVTLGHYNQNAETFWNGTKDHDVAQNYEAFLAPFPDNKKLDILDLGCGPGRDVNYFKSLGHRPVGLDGSEIFCSMARTGTRVVRFFIKSFLAWNCPGTHSMGFLPMPRCFMFPAGNCHESFLTYTPH